jgi:hypothetical protein
MEKENVEVPVVVEEEAMEAKPKVYLQVSLSTAELPKVDYCCFIFDLQCGLNVWLTIESIIWAFLFVAGLTHEIIYADEIDLLDFSDATKGWYHYLIFGDESIEVDQKRRSE